MTFKRERQSRVVLVTGRFAVHLSGIRLSRINSPSKIEGIQEINPVSLKIYYFLTPPPPLYYYLSIIVSKSLRKFESNPFPARLHNNYRDNDLQFGSQANYSANNRKAIRKEGGERERLFSSLFGDNLAVSEDLTGN